MPGKTRTTSRYRRTLAAAAGLALITISFPARALEISHPDAVVELFTSQGCSSCPAADQVLRKFNAGDELLGLAFHVDYWDRLGWKDTFASPENTQRQWQYARSLGERQVYTPQAVINGRVHVVGSREKEIIDRARQFTRIDEGLFVPVEVSNGGDVLSVRIGPLDQHATLYAVYFRPSAEVVIEQGENGGRTLAYSNIVGKMEMLGMAGNRGIEADFSITEMRRKGFGSCALILQANKEDGLPGPIIGATVVSGIQESY